MVVADDIRDLFQRYVTVRFIRDEEDASGRIIEITNDAFVIQHHSESRVVPFADVASVAEKTRGVSKRVLRVIPADRSVRQHLADRHAIPVTLLNHADEASCHGLHASLDHSDLGHRHATPSSAEERMALLDE